MIYLGYFERGVGVVHSVEDVAVDRRREESRDKLLTRVKVDDNGVVDGGSLEASMDDVDVDGRNSEEEWILNREDPDHRGCRLYYLRRSGC